MPHRRTLASLLAGTAVAAAGLAVSAVPSLSQSRELNALVWCDHADPAFLRPFEEANDVKVNVKEYEGTGTALSIIEQSQPGDWDVFAIDGIDVPRAVEAGLLAPLDEAKLPMGDLFEEVKLLEQQKIDGKLYGVTDKFGYNTISFDKSKIDAETLGDMSALWDEALKGKLSVYDYYLPLIGMVALEQGIDTADISMENLPQIKERLFELKDQSTSVGEVVASQTALATGEVDVLVGGGEWLTANLAAEQPDLDWIIPEEGGIFWSISMAVMADSENKDLAHKFVEYTMSPEGQARLATSSCFWAMPANMKAGDNLSDQQKQALRWDDQPDYLDRSQLYPAPDAELDAAMQDLWTEFLAR